MNMSWIYSLVLPFVSFMRQLWINEVKIVKTPNESMRLGMP